MKLNAVNEAKIYLAVIAGLQAEFAKIDNDNSMDFAFEPMGGGGVILNVYPSQGQVGAGDGGTILLEDSFDREGPTRILATLESSEGDPDTFWIIPTAADFEEKIAEIVSKAIPRFLV